MGIKLLDGKIPALAFSLVLYCGIALALETFPFTGEINSDNINIRSDSTVTSPIVCQAPKKTRLEVIKESYGWYKVRLPKNASCYINKGMVECITKPQGQQFPANQITNQICQEAKVIKENVNIRQAATQKSSILGIADNGEIVTVIGEEGEWYKIVPTANAFGWVNKRFIAKTGQ